MPLGKHSGYRRDSSRLRNHDVPMQTELSARQEKLLAKSSKKRGGESFDEIWVVADAESEHENRSSENISHAINQAGDDVHLVLDSPSIEYWSCCILSEPHVIFPQQLMSSLNFGDIGLDTPNRAGSSTGLL